MTSKTDTGPKEQDSNDEETLDALYLAVDGLLSAGQFTTVDALLRGWECRTEGVERTLGLLTLVAHTSEDQLKDRRVFQSQAAQYIHHELCSEAPETLVNLVPDYLRFLNDKELPCKTCDVTTMHRFRPSPEAGPYWRCSVCGNKTCVSPNGRTDGHNTYAQHGDNGVMVCAFCKEPLK